MTLADFFGNAYVLASISAVAGALLNEFVNKLKSKTAVLRYQVRVERLALAGSDAIFGAVKVSWQGHDVRNLFMATIEIDNATTQDFEKVTFQVYTGKDALLLSERTSVENSPYIVKYSESFQKSIAVAEGQVPTQAQWDVYYHSREYTASVLNRGQRLRLTYVCTNPTSDETPHVFVSTEHKGARLEWQQASPLVFGVPVGAASGRGVLVTAGVVVACSMLIGNVWIVAGAAAAVGLMAQFFGAYVYKAERWLRRLISG